MTAVFLISGRVVYISIMCASPCLLVPYPLPTTGCEGKYFCTSAGCGAAEERMGAAIWCVAAEEAWLLLGIEVEGALKGREGEGSCM